MRSTSPAFGVSAALVVLGLTATASAQYGVPAPYPQPYAPPPAGYGAPPPGYGQPGYGAPPGYAYPPPPAPPAPSTQRATALEMGSLYVTATGYGVGTGIWIDAIAGIGDPGLRFIFPGIFGVAAPVTVFVLDRYSPMKRGMPSAIATGMLIGAGEGLGIASFQFVSADEADVWGFTGLATAEFVGATLGGAAGAAAGYFLRPSPKSNVFAASAVGWGTLIGSAFGAGASNGEYGVANDTISLGGLIGFNVGLGSAAALSAVWVPSWEQIGFMWGGFALGAVVSLPVYIFYAGSDYDPRRGLIFQGVASTIGIGAGALLGRPDKKGALVRNEDPEPAPRFAQVLGGGLLPVPGGMGAQVVGQLW